MRKSGFTLIELLAVIVILAIIALIATPIVLNIINDTKESSQLRSAEFYLDAVENSIALSMLKNIKITDRDYNIMSDGNICLETYDSMSDECIGVDNRINHKDDILKVEVSGEVPKKGSTITLQNGKITQIKLTYDDNIKPIVKKDGKLDYEDIEEGSNGKTLDAICTYDSTSGVPEKTVGARYNCKVDPNKDEYTFYVLSTPSPTDSSINLIMDSNIRTNGEAIKEESPTNNKQGLIAWLSEVDYGCGAIGSNCSTNEKGPITAMNYL